jgi:hypothetical protein
MGAACNEQLQRGPSLVAVAEAIPWVPQLLKACLRDNLHPNAKGPTSTTQVHSSWSLHRAARIIARRAESDAQGGSTMVKDFPEE